MAGKGTEPDYLKGITTTADVKVPEKLVDQVIGQANAVEITRKAAAQKRNVLLVGLPGTGKSMLAQAMTELLTTEELEDVLVVANPLDENKPRVRVVKAGEGRKIMEAQKAQARVAGGDASVLMIAFLFLASFFILFFGRQNFGDVITAALLISLFVVGAAVMFGAQLGRMRLPVLAESAKLIVDNAGRKKAPFVDATGARAGALLGDVKHDPYQTGGLGTPAHLRIEAGAIHRAHKGVLFIDEIAILLPKAQQELLTALQEKKYPITGQSELSSGALVRTEPVPCDFVLVAAGNYQAVQRMHPALRSRIRGYGYEVFMEDSTEDTLENRRKLVQFIAQEVKKDGKIPHFDRSAIEEIISDARRKAGRKNKLTPKLRELGGLVRAAGDLARTEGAKTVTGKHVERARAPSRTLEQQAAQQAIDIRRDYRVFVTKGQGIGKVNGLAVMSDAGIIQPINAEIAPASSKQEGKIIATGKLGEIAREAVENVSAIIKKHTGKDISNYDIHVQFLQTHEGVEGDSASVSVATAVISALEDIPIRQSVAMTGSLSVRGEVLPVGGVTPKVEAAIEGGIATVLVPQANEGDVILDEAKMKKIRIVPVANFYDVLRHSLVPGKRTESLLARIRREFGK
ncbi:MAG: ATP-dependent protease LonB [Candidatus Micrarchaeota archaeon]|nr:ATP-dependent protease LonB [Candidatus Micrarchaeota archaeon]